MHTKDIGAHVQVMMYSCSESNDLSLILFIDSLMLSLDRPDSSGRREFQIEQVFSCVVGCVLRCCFVCQYSNLPRLLNLCIQSFVSMQCLFAF